MLGFFLDDYYGKVNETKKKHLEESYYHGAVCDRSVFFFRSFSSAKH